MLTPRQMGEWERLYLSQPWTADSVEETVGILGTVLVNMFSSESSPRASPNHFRALPRPAAPARHEAMTVSALVSRMGGGR